MDSTPTLAIVIVVGTLLAMVVMTLLILAVIIWTFRRVARPAEDAAVHELKRRLAAGEISPVEYEVRLRALTKGDE
jgi:uncharacterized membrane protein